MTEAPKRHKPAKKIARHPLIPQVAEAGILIVEDNPVNAMMLEEILRSGGFDNLAVASDGEEALKVLESFQPTLMIIDLIMPGMDGFTLCRVLREMPQYRNTPIIVQTALENEKERLSIFDIGATDLITKPFNPDELLARTETHLEKQLLLHELQSYQQRMEEDLSSARELQNLLMPDQKALQQIAQRSQLDIAACYEPSTVISGDFWGIHSFSSPDKLAVYSGDFTGHGVTSAINVFRIKTLISRMDETTLERPDACLEELNQNLREMLPVGLFATMFYGVIDIKRDTLYYAAAGCPPPILFPSDSEIPIELESRGLPVAARQDTRYELYDLPFKKKDMLLLYSDALIESPNLTGDFLTEQEVKTTLQHANKTAANAQQTLDPLVEQFHRHTTKKTPSDDLTITLIKRLGES